MVQAILVESDLVLSDDVVETIVDKVYFSITLKSSIILKFFLTRFSYFLWCWVSTDICGGRLKRRWEDWPRRMERIRGKESISAQEHDSTLSNVRFKFYGMSLLLLAYEVLDIVPKCTQLNGSLFLFFMDLMIATAWYINNIEHKQLEFFITIYAIPSNLVVSKPLLDANFRDITQAFPSFVLNAETEESHL